MLQRGSYATVDSDNRRVFAFVREYEGETLLVLMNLSGREIAASDYALSIDTIQAEGDGASVIFGDGALFTPMFNDVGGFTNYIPFETLPPYSTFVISLGGTPAGE
ncbi:MAG: hypothetical protein HC828_10785 [Blastochloris sp.]|nr:hypothetical protein [Blastochloris sp.]